VLEMTGQEGEASTLYLNVGLENGVLLRTVVDPVTGNLSDTRTRSACMKMEAAKLSAFTQ
jgi:hypothetical protein